MSYAYTGTAKDYCKLQGVTHPTDLAYQTLRDYNVRHVTISNSSPIQPVGIAVTLFPFYEDNATPPIATIIQPGKALELAINSHGSAMQYLWLMNTDGKVIGDVYPFRSDANEMVIRHGINKMYINHFKHPSYAAAK